MHRQESGANWVQSICIASYATLLRYILSGGSARSENEEFSFGERWSICVLSLTNKGIGQLSPTKPGDKLFYLGGVFAPLEN
jgi:hypothetical protein